MSALKKTSVAVMIMFVCIILAIVIGESRKDIYENPSAHQETLVGNFNELTTWGSITSSIEENFNFNEDAGETEGKTGIGVGGILLILVIVLFVFKGFGKKS